MLYGAAHPRMLLSLAPIELSGEPAVSDRMPYRAMLTGDAPHDRSCVAGGAHGIGRPEEGRRAVLLYDSTVITPVLSPLKARP